MAKKTIIKFKSEGLLTKQDKKDISALRDKQKEYVEAKAAADTPEKAAEIKRQIEEIEQQIEAIYASAEHTYVMLIQDMADDMERAKAQIIDDAKDIIKQLGIDYVTNIISLSVGMQKETESIDEAFYNTLYRFSDGLLVEQVSAASAINIDISDELKALVKARADRIIIKYSGVRARGTDRQDAIAAGIKQIFENASKSGAPAEPIIATSVVLPESFYTPNSYVSNNMPFWEKSFYQENNGQITFVPHMEEMDISGKDFKEPAEAVPVFISLDYEGDITQEGTNLIDYNKARIDGVDRDFMDAICSFLESGQDTLYLSAIDNFMKGGKSRKMSPQREERLLLSLRKWSGHRLYMDVSNDKRVNSDLFKKAIGDKAMLSYSGLELTTYAGQRTYVFHIDELPPLYSYSKAKGEIVAFPACLLDTGDRAEERLTSLKIQLLKRITLMNKKQLHNTHITYDYIYSRAGLKEPDIKTQRAQRARDKSKFEEWLGYWKNIGYIKDYAVCRRDITIEPKYIEPKQHYISNNATGEGDSI